MSIAKNKELTIRQLFNFKCDYFQRNTVSRRKWCMLSERITRKSDWKIPTQYDNIAQERTTRREFAIGASVLSDFYVCRGRVGIMKSCVRNSFVCSLPSFPKLSPKKLQKSNHSWARRSEICFSLFDCQKCSELHIKLNDCGNIYLLAISKLYASLNNWVNIHHVWWCCVLLITLQCCSNLSNPQKYRFEFFDFTLDVVTDYCCDCDVLGWISINVFAFNSFHHSH